MFGLEEELQDKMESTERKLKRSKNKITELKKDLRFALSCISWDDVSNEDLKEVKRLCIKAKMVDEDGNWHI